MHNYSSSWLHRVITPIQSLNSLKMVVHSMFFLWSTSLALFLSRTTLSIYCWISLGCASAFNFIPSNCSWRSFSRSSSTSHSSWNNSIYLYGSSVKMNSGSWCTSFLKVDQTSVNVSFIFSIFFSDWSFKYSSCIHFVCAIIPSYINNSTLFSACWFHYSKWLVEALTKPTSCGVGKWAISPDVNLSSIKTLL